MAVDQPWEHRLVGAVYLIGSGVGPHNLRRWAYGRDAVSVYGYGGVVQHRPCRVAGNDGCVADNDWDVGLSSIKKVHL